MLCTARSATVMAVYCLHWRLLRLLGCHLDLRPSSASTPGTAPRAATAACRGGERGPRARAELGIDVQAILRRSAAVLTNRLGAADMTDLDMGGPLAYALLLASVHLLARALASLLRDRIMSLPRPPRRPPATPCRARRLAPARRYPCSTHVQPLAGCGAAYSWVALAGAHSLRTGLPCADMGCRTKN